jgi:hypothetical protein
MTRKQVHPPQGYFDKPLEREKLLAKINELLSTKDRKLDSHP